MANSREVWAAFTEAVGFGDLATFVQILDRGFDVHARYGNHSAPVLTLVAQVADPAAPEMLRLLLSRGADIHAADKGGKTAMHYVARSGSVGNARALLESGADVNANNSLGFTPLHWMLFGNDPTPEMVRFLVDAGSDLDARAKNGRTPRDVAAREGIPL